MDTQERLREAVDQRANDLWRSVPPDRVAATCALINVVDQLSAEPGEQPDLITGRHIVGLGANKALQICLDATNGDLGAAKSNEDLIGWARRFLAECGALAEAELVLSHVETGFMRLVNDGSGSFDAWIATKRMPATWRERADFDWWASSRTRRYRHELVALKGARTDAELRRLADVHVTMMGHQFGYAPDALIGGCTVKTYLDVLGWLIAWALEANQRADPVIPQSEEPLVNKLAAVLAIDPGTAGRAVAAFTLDRENAAYHAAVPGVAAAPLVRIDSDRLIWSVHGLTTEPLLFLARELRRRYGQEVNNTGYLREAVFREDLYALFQDKRFVASEGRIVLRRSDRDVRTDIDAVVFDRKSGSLGLFEFKSQDPFARSTAELTRQRDNFLYANRQVSGMLDWVKRHGADEILNRVDRQTAKTFRAQKVYPFVLGRYLAHFNDGPTPDPRAAWGTWPQMLRLLEEQPMRATDSSPIASLFNRLKSDSPLLREPADLSPREIDLGEARLIVYPSYAVYDAKTRSGVP